MGRFGKIPGLQNIGLVKEQNGENTLLHQWNLLFISNALFANEAVQTLQAAEPEAESTTRKCEYRPVMSLLWAMGRRDP